MTRFSFGHAAGLSFDAEFCDIIAARDVIPQMPGTSQDLRPGLMAAANDEAPSQGLARTKLYLASVNSDKAGAQFGNLFFQRAETAQGFGQLLRADPLPLGLLIRRGGDAEHCCAVGNVAHHTGLGSDDGLIAQREVPGNP